MGGDDMTIEMSQGRRRPRVPRPGEHAMTVATVLAGPYKDPATGRFVKGTQAARLRGLKTAAKLTTLNPASCATWVRPYIELAQREASELVVEVAAESSPSLMAFAEDAATAVAMHRAFMAIALHPETDVKTKAAALGEARQWLKERRQSLLSLRGEARAGLPERAEHGGDPADLDRQLKEFEAKRERERAALAAKGDPDVEH
jgi:hypothetical protein